jgi:hypothetical protein
VASAYLAFPRLRRKAAKAPIGCPFVPFNLHRLSSRAMLWLISYLKAEDGVEADLDSWGWNLCDYSPLWGGV